MLLRSTAQERRFLISKHAFQRMGERGIDEEDVEKCALLGKVIESQDHGDDIKLLLQSMDFEGQDFYMIVALRHPEPSIIVTVCRFLKDVWGDQGSFRKR